ncbi:electron transfer flavoprotein subunit beta/FixA family protein [Derxia lacustris]|uniref:electron transfer flavoprotein subunit beta/FixA family protein n=1 Tax=Derxia lacustris TaxID=764842 RepID=UPI000A172729|nr:electron transfer flavoprotein subunit beta/FixA family protein [Derxia lacustris]
MHILVPVKRVIDYNVKVRVKADGSGVETAGVKMSSNPFDEVAVEQAVRLREQGIATKVTVVAFGPAVVADVLRNALALGADAALRVETDGAPDALAEARLLKALVEREGVDLVLCGKQAIDDDLGSTGPMLAGLLGWPQAVSVNALAADGSTLKLSCDGDAGIDRFELELPAVLSVDLRLCDPRHITLPGMMKAKKAPIATALASDLGGSAAVFSDVVGMAEPPQRLPGIRVASTDELIARLRELPALRAA